MGQRLLTAQLTELIIQYMKCNPGGDISLDSFDVRADPEWLRVLAHRQREPVAVLGAVIERFGAAGVTPEIVESHLQDAGDRLYAAAASGRVSWSADFGGDHAVALIAAEVSALASHLVARAAGIRAASIEALLEEYSAITVASSLGVARQKVYELAKGSVGTDFMKTTPWSPE
ncbi:hypothetical protein [Glutamicibacter soli]